MQIKLFQASDIEAVQAFLAQENEGRENDYLGKTFDEQNQGKREFFLLDENGLIGFCQYNRAPKYRPFRSLNIPEIQDLYIAKGHRRKGYAERLVMHCENRARQESHDLIGIGVSISAAYGNAQKLYAKLGYKPDGAGVVYDREAVQAGKLYPIDDELCLMMIKELGA